MSQLSDHDAAETGPNAPHDLSDFGGPNDISPNLPSFHHRPGYHRLSSAQEEEDTSYRGHYPQISELPEDDSVHGLRIRFSDHDEEALHFGATVEDTPDTRKSISESLLSPSTARTGPRGRSNSTGSSPYEDTIYSNGRTSPASSYRLDAPFRADTEEELMHLKRSPSTIKSFDTSGMPPKVCKESPHRSCKRCSVGFETLKS